MAEGLLKRCPPVDVRFEGLTYKAKGKKGTREILKSLNGSFYAGNLIGILGASGAGKTSLLNVLAGHIIENVSGTIKINGVQRELKSFQKLSRYIMQEDVIQKHLTVLESMTFAAKLKLGNEVDDFEQRRIVANVINTLGLQPTVHTRTEHLSGGQRKRVAIALELINNPPVLFFDEPTTGLDNVGAKQCLQLLKDLAKQGRTVICTIHQPSDLLFRLFDQVYFMSEGACVYNGSVDVIVPFLQRVERPCPSNSSPADYIIELTNRSERNTKLLSAASRNGKLNNCNPELSEKFLPKKPETVYNSTTHSLESKDALFRYPLPFLSQVLVLLSRMFLQLARNKTVLVIQVAHHLVCALAVGMSFLSVGNDATLALANFKFLIGMILFYVYTHLMSPILLFPFELELIKREYFNHWYSLKAYYTALTISTLPLMVLLCFLYNTIVYIMTDQPMELTRFVYFNLLTVIIALTSYGIGISIGSTFRPTTGAVIGAALGVILVLLCMYGMGYEDGIEPPMRLLMSLDYMRHGLEGLCVVLLRGRPMLACDGEVYCHFRDPEKMLRTMGMADSTVAFAVAMVVAYLVTCRAIAYVALRRVVKPGRSFAGRCLSK